MKHDGESSPLVSESRPGDDDDDARYSARDRDCSFWNQFRSLCPPHFGDDHRGSPNNSRISMLLLLSLALAGLISIYSVASHLNTPYLCKKDGIVLHCPHVKDPSSLWENPYSATTSWKPCAERHHGGISDILHENETNGYIFIHAEGGLNQQRIAFKAGPDMEGSNEI